MLIQEMTKCRFSMSIYSAEASYITMLQKRLSRLHISGTLHPTERKFTVDTYPNDS